MTIEKFAKSFKLLPETEQENLINRLFDILTGQSDITSLPKMSVEDSSHAIRCPQCNSTGIWGNGTNTGQQRFKCKDCKKCFSANTGKFTWWLKKKHKIPLYIKSMFLGHTLSQSEEFVGISRQTACDWRHKILSVLNEVTKSDMEGIIEILLIEFPYSEKGRRKSKSKKELALESQVRNVKVLTIADRKGNQALNIACKGPGQMAKLPQPLFENFRPVEYLCCRQKTLLRALKRSGSIPDEYVRNLQGPTIAGRVFNTKRTEKTDRRLKNWMTRFYGVVSKYLHNYLNWFLILQKLSTNVRKEYRFFDVVSTSHQTWHHWKRMRFAASMADT